MPASPDDALARLESMVASQAEVIAEQAKQIEQLRVDMEQQRLDRLTLARHRVELESSAGERRVSRAGLLKAAAAGAAGLLGAGVLENAGTGVALADSIGTFSSSTSGPAMTGESPDTGDGVYGSSTNGYGGNFQGGLAPIRLQPGTGAGAASTSGHQRGELYVDSNGVLYYFNGSVWQLLPVKDDGGQVFNVDAYGAVGDGVTLDDTAIANCMADANRTSPNGAVIVFSPQKTYLHQNALRPYRGQTLQGYGAVLKRANQVSSRFSGAVTSGSTTTLTGVTSTTGFAVGQTVEIWKGTKFDSATRTITSPTANSITISTPFGVSIRGGKVAAAACQVSIPYTSDYVTIRGLTFDGNHC